MDSQSSIYSEKKLSSYETVYRESVLSKPQEISLTITAAHIYGLAYICDQIGTKEEDPVYTRFTCSIEEISKIYINVNNKNSPIYIQCDEHVKNSVNRRRIILPSFGSKVDEIVSTISNLVSEQELKKKDLEEKRANDYSKLKKAVDDEFNSITSGYKNSIPSPSAHEIKAVETKSKANIIDPDEIFNNIRKPIHKSEFSSDAIVNDMLGIDEILTEIESSAITAHVNSVDFDVVDNEPNEEELEAIPIEVLQKAPAEIEEVSVPDFGINANINEIKPSAPVVQKNTLEIEEVDTEKIIQQKIAEKLKKANDNSDDNKIEEDTPVVNNDIKETEPVVEKAVEKVSSADNSSVNASSMSLDEFEDAVKKLKIMLDTGAITENEFAIEKKKLLSTLY